MKRGLAIATFCSGVTMLASVASADEFGCKVLLCAAADNPSWPSIPYCVPVMHRLYSMMAKPGFDWPVCPDAGTGAPSYQKYEDCPTGWTPTTSDAGDKIRTSGTQLDQCTRRKPNCSLYPSNRKLDEMDNCVEVIARPLRDKPYYFDIPTNGTTQRAWFNIY